jgi:hypothetical protein
MECILHELSAIYPVKTLKALYNEAIDDAPYSFLYVNMTSQDKAKMFYIRFEEAMVLE